MEKGNNQYEIKHVEGSTQGEGNLKVTKTTLNQAESIDATVKKCSESTIRDLQYTDKYTTIGELSMTNESMDANDKTSDHGNQRGPMVTITVNNVNHEIHRGHQTIVAIKTVGKVPLADDLEEVVDKKLIPLPDDGAITLKGGEIFVSHPKDSGSSHV